MGSDGGQTSNEWTALLLVRGRAAPQVAAEHRQVNLTFTSPWPQQDISNLYNNHVI